MSPDGLRLLIADDEPLARDLLRRYAGGVPGLELVRECATGDEVAEGLARDRPDVARHIQHRRAAEQGHSGRGAQALEQRAAGALERAVLEAGGEHAPPR